MIKLLELYPQHLNLNGDAGNLLILRRRIEWSGVEVSLSRLELGAIPDTRPDIVLVGHGSTEAWKQAYPHLAKIAPTLQLWLNSGTQILAVSSGFAALHGLIHDLPKSIARVGRESKFVVTEFEGQQVFGYKNTDLELADIVRVGNLIGTSLHGPLLAKNTWLADLMIDQALAGNERGAINVQKFDDIQKLADAACKLASEQAES